MRALLEAETPAVCLVAKSDLRHVERALRTTAEENLAMVADTVSYMVAEGRRVFLDCEHFFDGFRYNPEYTASVVRHRAPKPGRRWWCMCDTNGGMLPSRITAAIEEWWRGPACRSSGSASTARTTPAARWRTPSPRWRPACGTSSAPPTGTVSAPATPTCSRWSATCSSSSGCRCCREGGLEQMVRVSHAIAEIANLAPDTHQPYVGSAAFAHKAGLHASAIKVDPVLYNHIDPAVVGNDMRILVTEMAGRASIELKSRELGLDLGAHPEALARSPTWSRSGRRPDGRTRPRTPRSNCWCGDAGDRAEPFTLESYRVQVEHRDDGAVVSEATVKLAVAGERVIATAEGNGPVNALDQALRAALTRHYPRLAEVALADYKVRILAGSQGTAAVTRVLVESVDRPAGTGPRSGCTRTWWRRAGTPWWTRSPTHWCTPTRSKRREAVAHPRPVPRPWAGARLALRRSPPREEVTCG